MPFSILTASMHVAQPGWLVRPKLRFLGAARNSMHLHLQLLKVRFVHCVNGPVSMHSCLSHPRTICFLQSHSLCPCVRCSGRTQLPAAVTSRARLHRRLIGAPRVVKQLWIRWDAVPGPGAAAGCEGQEARVAIDGVPAAAHTCPCKQL